MGLKRWGMSLFGVGLLVGSVAWLFGVEWGCEAGTCGGRGAPSAGTVLGVDPGTLAVEVAGASCGDVCTYNAVVALGAVLVLLGVLVGGVGVARDALDVE
ncbi:hypothetical protein ACFO0N_04320 [Halobium salinum]|uniref:Transmembrane protein n=1 Tax=Halobium salinum TaxID=1364940 RepID=A0ABD5P8E4_9EURY|nr:hypothetical protein [Halobium salinum]